jgi:hypothetical protein
VSCRTRRDGVANALAGVYNNDAVEMIENVNKKF